MAHVWRLEDNLWGSLLPAYVSWGLNSGRLARQEVHSLSEPSLQARYAFLKFWKGAKKTKTTVYLGRCGNSADGRMIIFQALSLISFALLPTPPPALSVHFPDSRLLG